MTTVAGAGVLARRIHVSGVVQGVGFRPYVLRLARAHGLCGWVCNGGDGVRIHVQGRAESVDAFVADLTSEPPAAASIAVVDVEAAEPATFDSFEIRASDSPTLPTTRVSPDLAICDACLAELFDPHDRRYRYPYINCTNCGPRFSIVRALPYDRANTTMDAWPLCASCAVEYHDPDNRRFHAQPVACAACGPEFRLVGGRHETIDTPDPIAEAARLLRGGRIVAVKGIGGYHLACDADNAAAVAELRERKYRKEQPFALMLRDVADIDATVDLTGAARALLTSPARPIVLAPARVGLPGVAPDNHELGVMLPYTPLHHLLFAAGAPTRLVMTSGNRSSEPIAFDDGDAFGRLDGLADAWLVGDRPIARRVDDSVVRGGPLGPVVLRRSRGLAPGVVATLPDERPILAVGGDLKNSVTLVVDGQACVSQHVGDLSHYQSRQAFAATVRDLLDMYRLAIDDVTVVHDAHPQYVSTQDALALGAHAAIAVQHHRAHVASVLAERGELDRRVVAAVFDGTGYGDDGTIWGGEFFAGSVREGFARVAHLRPALLAGGDAAARHPVQAAAGFLWQIASGGDLMTPPFDFPDVFPRALALVRTGLRSFAATSAGRLFDAVAALAGFTRPITFEGQAAMWLEHAARAADPTAIALPIGCDDNQIDWRPTLGAIVEARRRGVAPAVVARAFHRALASATASMLRTLAAAADVDTIVLSGGVFQNQLLVEDILDRLGAARLRVWVNHAVPANDGGLSLGQAAIAACGAARNREPTSQPKQRTR